MTTGTVKRTATSKWLSTSMLGGGALLCLLGAPVAAHADDLPTGGTVAAGAATIASNGQTTTVNQTSTRAVINWGSFSVGQDKTVDFIQPDAQSATLNRVTGNTTSTIAGLVRSNGAVYLINPNGIAITATGAVQTGGGFVASTLNMTDADFMGGKNNFAGSGSSAGVSNAGHITAGAGAYVALLGGSVSNSGSIAVPLGRVGLGSGESITLDLNGDGFMQVAVPTSALTGDRALIEHSGTISASGGLVMLTAATVKDAVRNVINLSGGINADSAVGSGGRIILFGGDGGTVTVNGTLTARATGATGDGGLVETSGATVNFAGLKVDTSSIGGKSGTWLIDPTSMLIDSAAAATISSNLATTDIFVSTSANGTTSGPGTPTTNLTGLPDGSILINAPISWSSSHMLFFSAFADIGIQGAISGPNGYFILSSGVGYSRVGHITANAAIDVGIFELRNGFFSESTSVPFYARDFRNGGAFLRTAGGSGTVDDPYLISDVFGLQGIGSLVGQFDPTGPSLYTRNYRLTNDIDASGTALWYTGTGGSGAYNGVGFRAIGDSGAQFSGSLSGAPGGSKITGLFINGADTDIGLFGYIGSSGRVTDINLVGGSVHTAILYSGGQAHVGALAGVNDGTILRSSASTAVSGDSIWANNLYVGGLVGLNNGSITASSASGSVTGGAGFYSVGGLVGYLRWGTISKSYATGVVRGGNLVGSVGGLAGTNESGTISQSYASGAVHVADTGANGGGLVGKNWANGLITDSYAAGSVDFDISGGFSGTTQIGGLVGVNVNAFINRSFATGFVGHGVTGSFIGGLVGDSAAGISNSFWDVNSTGQQYAQGTTRGPVTDGATGLTTAQMQNFASYATTFAGFDFTNVWAPPAQAGQAGQTSGYYPQLFATTPIVMLTGSATKVYGAPLSSIVTGQIGGTGLYAFGPSGDGLATPAITGVSAGANVGSYAFNYAVGTSTISLLGVTYRVINGNGAGTLSITPAPLTVTYTADPFTRLYGAANPAFTGTQNATGLVNGDTLAGVTTGAAVYGSTANGTSNVGSYAINGSGLSANTGNYTFTFAQAAGNATALTINPASLSVVANPLSRTYGDVNPALTYVATGLVNGDTLTGGLATPATSSSNVGSYAITQGSLAASNNYVLTFTGASLIVTPAALTITYIANPFSRTYGPFNPTVTGTESTSGLRNGDTFTSIISGTATYTPTANMYSNVGIYGITGSGLSGNSANYTFTFAQAAGNATAYTITPAPVTIVYSANPTSRFYGAANPAFTGSQLALGLFNTDTLASVTTGTATYSSTATSGSNVGNYAVTGSGLSGNNSNYAFTFVQANSNSSALRIDPAFATITYTANPFTRLYGAANPTFTGTASAGGLVNGDTLATATSGTAIFTSTATAGSNIGSYAINGSGLTANNGNYTFNFIQAVGNATALSITPASLSVTADPLSRTYGAANPALTYSSTGLVNGDTLSGALATTATSSSNVGSYAITQGNLAASSNYVLTFTGASLIINPAALTVTYTADPFSRLYGASNPAFTGTQSATGLVNGDTLAGVTSGAAIYGSTATSGSNVGSYAINGSGLSSNSGNYAFTFVQAAGNATALSVTPASATITYTADPFSRLYGAGNPAFTGTQSATGLVNGDTLAGVTSGTAVYSSTATSGSNVGSYAVNGSGLSGSTGNYNLTFVQAAGNATALSITPASLTISYNANPLSRLYGAANPTFTGTQSATGLVNGDTLTGVTSGTASYSSAANAGSNVGTYAVTGSGLSANSGNYNFTFVQGAGNATALSVTPASATITYTADPFSRLYGAANPAFTGTQSATGLVNGDTLGGVTSGTAVYGTTATSGSNVGSYAINGSGLSGNSGNYIFTFAQAAGNATALSVTPASVTITYTANPFSRLYGAANPAFTGTQSAAGLVNGDTLGGVTAGTAIYGSTANATSNVGSYAINGSGLSGNSGNYTFTFAQAAGNATALSVTPASLSVVANPLSRTYGAANPALTYNSTGLVNGDTLSGALATTATSSSNVGSYAITQGSLAASSNYILTFTGASLIINPAALTVTYTASPLSRIYGAANPAFTGTQSATGLVNGDTLAGVTSGTAVYGSTAGVTSNVGSYAITGSGLTANSGNYSFTFVQAAGNATALSVTPRALSVTANPISRQFGVPNPPLTYVVGATTATSGLVNGDVLTGALSTTATQTSPSGDYLILQGTLAASSNYTFTYTGAVLKIALPPLQSLSSFVAIPSDLNVTFATEQSQGCTDAEVSESMRETGSAKLGDGSGSTSCK